MIYDNRISAYESSKPPHAYFHRTAGEQSVSRRPPAVTPMTPADIFSGMNWDDVPYDGQPLSQAEQQRLAKAFVLNNDRVFMLRSNKIKNQLPEEQDAMVAWMRRVSLDNIWHATGGGRIYWLWEDMRKIARPTWPGTSTPLNIFSATSLRQILKRCGALLLGWEVLSLRSIVENVGKNI